MIIHFYFIHLHQRQKQTPMPRLQKSKNKCAALLDATLCLMNNGGIQEASMSKVAKMAGVSPATIYLYFENKQDLVNQLYINTKATFCKEAFHNYDPTQPVKKSFELIWYNIVDFKMKEVEKASFLAQCDNTPLIDEDKHKEGLKHLQPLLDLWERGKQEGIIKNISPYLLYAYTIYPMAFLIRPDNQRYCQLKKEQLKQAFQAAWDSIKV